jgi:hypothetical protein
MLNDTAMTVTLVTWTIIFIYLFSFFFFLLAYASKHIMCILFIGNMGADDRIGLSSRLFG